jgi:Phage integrase, N-terminal SAM-like domain
VRETTWQSYHSHVRENLSPGIGRIPLRELTTGQIQALFDALASRLNRYAQPLTVATLQRMRASVEIRSARACLELGGWFRRLAGDSGDHLGGDVVQLAVPIQRGLA